MQVRVWGDCSKSSGLGVTTANGWEGGWDEAQVQAGFLGEERVGESPGDICQLPGGAHNARVGVGASEDEEDPANNVHRGPCDSVEIGGHWEEVHLFQTQRAQDAGGDCVCTGVLGLDPAVSERCGWDRELQVSVGGLVYLDLQWEVGLG